MVEIHNYKHLIIPVILMEVVAIALLGLLTFSHVNYINGLANQPVNPLPTTASYTYTEDNDRGEMVDKQVTVNMTGDIMLASRVGEVIKKHGYDYPWLGVRDVLADADITIGNLECSVGAKDYQPMPDKQFTFLATPDALLGAKNAGIDVVTLANNHILDFGVGALEETLMHLDEYDIKHTGAGKNIAQALTPVIIEKNGLKIGVLALSNIFPRGYWVAGENKPGLISGYDYDTVFRSVKELSSTTDLTCVSIHWGEELADWPSQEQRRLSHRLVDQGADVIWGHHPHVIQGFERYNNALIAYSTGNFVFTLSRDMRGRQGIIFQVDAGSAGITGARVIPSWIEYGRTVLADQTQSATIIQRLQTNSRPFGTVINDSGEIIFR